MLDEPCSHNDKTYYCSTFANGSNKIYQCNCDQNVTKTRVVNKRTAFSNSLISLKLLNIQMLNIFV